MTSFFCEYELSDVTKKIITLLCRKNRDKQKYSFYYPWPIKQNVQGSNRYCKRELMFLVKKKKNFEITIAYTEISPWYLKDTKKFFYPRNNTILHIYEMRQNNGYFWRV